MADKVLSGMCFSNLINCDELMRDKFNALIQEVFAGEPAYPSRFHDTLALEVGWDRVSGIDLFLHLLFGLLFFARGIFLSYKGSKPVIFDKLSGITRKDMQNRIVYPARKILKIIQNLPIFRLFSCCLRLKNT